MLFIMTVTRYWGSIYNKIKNLFSALVKKTQSTFLLDNGNTYEMNDDPNEKRIFLLANSNTEITVAEWNNDMDI